MEWLAFSVILASRLRTVRRASSVKKLLLYFTKRPNAVLCARKVDMLQMACFLVGTQEPVVPVLTFGCRKRPSSKTLNWYACTYKANLKKQPCSRQWEHENKLHSGLVLWLHCLTYMPHVAYEKEGPPGTS